MTRAVVKDVVISDPGAQGATNFPQLALLLTQSRELDWKLLLEKWASRPIGLRFSVESYQATQVRVLPFLLVPPNSRSAEFLRVGKLSGILFSSLAHYWTALHSATKALGMSLPIDDSKVASMLEQQANLQQPHRPTMTAVDLAKTVQDLCASQLDWLADAATITFTLGQRFSDVMLLSRCSVKQIQQLTVLTFLEGKVVPYVGPFSLHLQTETRCASIVAKAVTRGWTRLFLPDGMDYEEARGLMSEALPMRDVRALRRGGLQEMGRQEVPEEVIMMFSMHSNIHMLRRYMNFGAELL